MTGFLAAFGVVFLAELGDKSQLLVLSLAARFSPWSVLAGLATVSATLMIVSVAVGASLATAVPEYALQVVAGVAFLGFAVWTWLDADEDEDEVAAA
ncbi:MAG TPA: TMEM165/GDT1 family protein, partial [Acidimicrobiia bacterium]|nr:TMEM165/GDT1 family protein [Acidimicrobiia bacterium]